MDVAKKLTKLLKQHGQSVTSSRLLVFEALQNREPQTMAELVRRVGNKSDRASVYRTIAIFEQLGIVQRLQIGWKYKLELSHEFSHHHHHMSCRSCGKVISISEDDTIEAQLLALAQRHQFTISSHQLEIQGLCLTCSKKV
jgi:Fur family transcriptional regulator, ferric uptake regulator